MIERRESVMMQEENFTLEQPVTRRRRAGSEFLQEANRLHLSTFFLSDPSGADLTIAFLLLLLLLLLQSLGRSSIKHQYFHDSSVGFNISYMVGKRTSPGFIWR